MPLAENMNGPPDVVLINQDGKKTEKNLLPIKAEDLCGCG